jgi:alkylation response protein AidB-like acyl-CoA dehydrogenase
VDFQASEEQRAILESVGVILARHAGVERAVALAAEGGYDHELAKALDEAGFLEVATETGALEGALVVEAVAAAAAVTSTAAEVLVAPMLTGRKLTGPIALAEAGSDAPARYAADARTLLLAEGDEARLVRLAPGAIPTVRSWYGYPMGRVDAAALPAGESLGRGSAERLGAWWRVALAVECVGSMASALDVTVDYLKDRRQFGRPIGSFQAVQHRLAGCFVRVEGARWLAYEAVSLGAPAEAAALAAGYAGLAAQLLFNETHQLSGAIGYTREHPLHAHSMRLQALRLELGGVASHFRGAARARWSRG